MRAKAAALHDVAMISTVVFDLFGTLTGAESQRDLYVAILADALGAPVEALANALRSTYDERARGVLGDVRGQIVTLSERVGGSLRPEVIDRAVGIRMDGQRAVLAPRAGSIAVLQSLRDRVISVGVLSDCTGEIPRLWPESEYAPLVAHAVFSCEMGIRKPDSRMYEAVLSRLEKRPEETLYVGDGGSSELSGATAMGMRAVLLRIDHERHVRYDEEVDWRGEVITDLATVPELLER